MRAKDNQINIVQLRVIRNCTIQNDTTMIIVKGQMPQDANLICIISYYQCCIQGRPRRDISPDSTFSGGNKFQWELFFYDSHNLEGFLLTNLKSKRKRSSSFLCQLSLTRIVLCSRKIGHLYFFRRMFFGNSISLSCKYSTSSRKTRYFQ